MLRLRTFGGLTLESDEGLAGVAVVQRRRLAILALLATAQDRGLSRDKLVAYLWPEADEERARHTLSQLLYALRRDLGAAVVIGTAGELRLDRQVLWSDVAEFEAALDRGERERAVALYTGPFLDGWFVGDAPEYERWIEHERGRLAQRAMLALRQLAEGAGERQEHDAAVRWWRQLATLDPLAAQPAIGLMTALARMGDTAAALKHARIYETLIRNELDAAPDPAVTALVDRLRQPEQETSRAAGRTRLPDVRQVEDTPSPALPSREAPMAQPATEISEPVRRRGRRHFVLLGAMAALVLIGFGASAPFLHRQSADVRPDAPQGGATPPALGRRSIAVLPFLNISSDPENEYFSDGITEELISTLGRVEGLRVTARTSSFAFKGKSVGISEMARQLGVATILEGSVRRSGKRLRVTAQLIDAANGYELWSDAYDRELTDVLHVQEEIARSIAAKLQGRLLDEPGSPTARRVTTNPGAYDLYLRGRYFWNQRTFASLTRSIEYYQRALALDSGYAMAYAGLADSYAILGANGLRPLTEVLPKVDSAAARALALDSTISTVHATRALTRWLTWDWAAAGVEFRRSIALDSLYAPVHMWYGLYLAGLRQSSEAIAELSRAREIDPLSLIVNTEMGRVLELSRRDVEAEVAYKRALEIDSTYPTANYLLAQLHLRRRQFAPASRDLARLAATIGESGVAALRAYGAAMQGNRVEATRFLAQLTRTGKRQYVSPYAIACIYTALGDRSRAFEWLDRGFDTHASEMYAIGVDPTLDSLRDDSRFAALMRRMHLN